MRAAAESNGDTHLSLKIDQKRFHPRELFHKLKTIFGPEYAESRSQGVGVFSPTEPVFVSSN